VNHIL